MIDFNFIEKYRENNRIEAKKALGGLPKSIWETYSAFANTMGGIILLGVEEINKVFHPINLPSPQQLIDEFWEILNDTKKVNINIISKQHIQIIKQKDICFIAIFVPRASKTDVPVYIDDDVWNGTYKRTGEGDYRVTKEEVKLMLDNKTNCIDKKFFEFSPDTLNQKSIEKFLEICNYNIDKNSLFKKLNIDKCISSTSLLVFGKYSFIKEIYPDFQLIFNDKTKKNFKGNLFDFYIEVMTSLNKMSFDKETLFCFEEALLNAMCNADYSSGAQILIKVSASHISFTNSGNFNVNIDDAKKGVVSDPRNPLIKKIFDMLKPVQIFMGGIPYIHMIWQKNGWSAPYFQQSEDTTTLKLYFYNIDFFNDNIPQIIASETIIHYLTEHIYADSAELAKMLNLPCTNIKVILEKMHENEIIVSVNRNNNLLYKLKD